MATVAFQRDLHDGGGQLVAKQGIADGWGDGLGLKGGKLLAYPKMIWQEWASQSAFSG